MRVASVALRDELNLNRMPRWGVAHLDVRFSSRKKNPRPTKGKFQMSSIFRKSLLSTSVMVAIASAAPAYAQDQQEVQDQPAASEGTIVVTGSRIANPNLEQSSPVSVLGAEEFALQSPASVEQLLRELPGTAPGINSQVNNGSNGTASFNLRGLGTNRNLVLLNSRRVVPSTLGNVVDLNIIPIAMLERADVFTGGAVTSYGADAVAGVVNFITRQDFSGLDLSASYGITERGDGDQIRLDLVTGANFDDGRGNVTLGVSYTQTDPVLQGNRQIGLVSRGSTCTAAQVTSGACEQRTVGSPQGSGTAVPASLFFPLPSTGAFANGAQFDPATGTIIPGLADYNFNPLNLFQTPLDRWSVFASGKYEVADNIEVYTEALFSRNKVVQELAPTGTFTNAFFVPLNNQFLSAAQRTQLCGFAGIADCGAAIASGQEIQAIAARRFVETGPRRAEFVSNVFQITAGVRGKLTETLNFDVFGQYGEANRRNTNTGTALAERVQQALRGCPTGSAAGCTPINIFGAAGTLTQPMLDFVGVPTSTFIDTQFASAQALVTGDLGFSSPLASNPVGIAGGVEYRKYSGGQFGDLPSRTPGAILGSGGAFNDISGSYDSYEAFAEINVPLISDRPFFHDLTAEGGVRYSEYSTSGGNWTWKAGGSWAPVPDIRFRGAYTRAVRAPNLGELFAPVSTGLNNLAVDPCQGAGGTAAGVAAICTAQLAAAGLPASRLGSIPAPIAGQINVTTGGNPDVDPEKARTLTLGGVFTPTFLPGFSLTLDWYRIRVTGAITSPTVGDVLNGCFGQSDPSDPRCQLIRRNPLTGGLSGDPATTQGVILASSNLGFLESEGWDLSASYSYDFGPVGLSWSFNGNYTTNSRFQSNASSFIRECVGFYSVSCDPVLPEFTWNMRTTATFEQADISLLWRHVDSTSYEPRTGATATTPPAAGTVGSFGSTNPASIIPTYRTIPSFDYFDVNLGFDFSDNMRFSVLVENLFDKNPPDVGNTIGSTSFNSGNTFPAIYDALGRRFTASMRLRF